MLEHCSRDKVENNCVTNEKSFHNAAISSEFITYPLVYWNSWYLLKYLIFSFWENHYHFSGKHWKLP